MPRGYGCEERLKEKGIVSASEYAPEKYLILAARQVALCERGVGQLRGLWQFPLEREDEECFSTKTSGRSCFSGRSFLLRRWFCEAENERP